MVSADDRACYFGDGVYEAVRLTRGRLWLMDEHMARFRRSLDAIQIEPGDLDHVRRSIDEIVQASGLAEGTVYFHMTRGQAPRDHAWPEGLTPNLFISVRQFAPRTDNWQRGVAAVTHPDLRWKRCDIKSLNLLANVLAKQKARTSGVYEAIFVDAAGRVMEGASTSCVMIAGGELVACPNGPHILPGITRAKIFDLAAANGIPAREAFFTVDEFYAADEVFLTGTGDEVMPVIRVDDRPIGPGTPGPVTRRLHDIYRRAIRDELGVSYP